MVRDMWAYSPLVPRIVVESGVVERVVRTPLQIRDCSSYRRWRRTRRTRDPIELVKDLVDQVSSSGCRAPGVCSLIVSFLRQGVGHLEVTRTQLQALVGRKVSDIEGVILATPRRK